MNQLTRICIPLQNWLLAFNLSLAACGELSAAQSFNVTDSRRSLQVSVVANVNDLGYWIAPSATTNCFLTDGILAQRNTMTVPSADVSLATMAFQTSCITAGNNNLLVTGCFGVNIAYAATTNLGAANWDLLSYLDLHFTATQPFTYSLAVTNYHTPDSGVAGYDSFVGLTDSNAFDIAALGESTYWYYLNLTNPASDTVSGTLPAGTYELRGIAADGLIYGGVLAHTAIRNTAFIFSASVAANNSTNSSAPVVTLGIAPATGGVVLSWPTNAADYVLQTRDMNSGTWVGVTNLPVQLGTNLQVTIAPATGSRLFRLAK